MLTLDYKVGEICCVGSPYITTQSLAIVVESHMDPTFAACKIRMGFKPTCKGRTYRFYYLGYTNVSFPNRICAGCANNMFDLSKNYLHDIK